MKGKKQTYPESFLKDGVQSSATQSSQPWLPLLIKATGLVSILGIGILDYLTGYQLSFSIFYLIPISWLAWRYGLVWGLVSSLISAAVWIIADLMADHTYANFFIPAWNAAVRMGFFMTTAVLLARLKATLEREHKMARTDFVTGILNSQAFMETLKEEVQRCRRYNHPLTIVYLDCDNFKAVNDSCGHETGNLLLREMAQALKNNLRPFDKVGRLGGDEFALLLTDTKEEPALEVVKRSQNKLNEVMRKNNWDVTFSAGAATFFALSVPEHEMLQKADDLMYIAKRKGKNRIVHKVFPANPSRNN